MSLVDLAADAFGIAIIAVILGIAVLAVCAAIQSGAQEEPRIPADVDLAQCVATTRAIAYDGQPPYARSRA